MSVILRCTHDILRSVLPQQSETICKSLYKPHDASWLPLFALTQKWMYLFYRILDRLRSLVAMNENLKKQEQQFRAHCKVNTPLLHFSPLLPLCTPFKTSLPFYSPGPLFTLHPLLLLCTFYFFVLLFNFLYPLITSLCSLFKTIMHPFSHVSVSVKCIYFQLSDPSFIS